MPDETVATPAVAEQAAAETTTTATSSDATKNTEKAAEVMIPKARFDEVNNRLKAIEQESAKAAKAAQEADAKRLADEGKFKELYEKQQTELLTAQQAAKANEMRLWQRDAAAKTGLPAALADRLKGETADEMEADAKSILAALPKPAAPNINAENGAGGAPAAGQMSDAEKQALAAVLGVNPKFM